MIDVPRGTIDRLHRFVELLLVECQRQNLIAPSTVKDVWRRHVEDSLQLLPLAPAGSVWVDIGTGAGFPGMVVALADARPVHLVEPRKLRADFLNRVVNELACVNATVHASRVEAVNDLRAGVISARAVAPLDQLFAAASHLAAADTLWLLPKGRRATEELAEARRSWQGVFHVEPSVTDPVGGIVVARDVAPKGRR